MDAAGLIASMRILATLALMTALGASGQPLVDYHQHLFHPAETGLGADSATVTATDLIAYLDAAGIRRALILSVAYQFANPNRPAVEDEYAKVRAENDWTSAQIAKFPDRLRGFCGFSPLRDYALEEMARCAQDRICTTESNCTSAIPMSTSTIPSTSYACAGSSAKQTGAAWRSWCTCGPR